MDSLAHAHGFVRGLFYLTVLIWVLSEVRQARHVRRDATPKDRNSRVAVALGETSGWVLAINAPRWIPGATFATGSFVVVLGLVACWLGIALRQWSFRTLGYYFTFVVTTSSDQPVIDSGPYRFVRHPSYTGIVIAMAGIGLVFANFVSLFGAVTLTLAGLVVRIRVEERALHEALGSRYDDFARGRRRLIPFLW